MQTRNSRTSNRETGSVLLVAAILLGIATLALASILIATTSHTRIGLAAYHQERAFQLADSGMAAAIVDLNNGRTGSITRNDSHGFFLRIPNFTANTWGFETVTSNIGPHLVRLMSTGTYGKQQAIVTADIELRSQTRDIHALYSFAIYAGNSSGSTNYTLDIGGTGSGADHISGDLYSGGNLSLSGDAKLRLPEAYTDTNGNGYWDPGELRNDSGTLGFFSNALTRAEFDAYVGAVNSSLFYENGRFDTGEAFIDTIGNGVYDPGEAFSDVNGDGEFGFGEPFVDADGDGVFDETENFVDHGNGVYDAGEAFEDLNGNGVWDPARRVREKVGKKKVWVDYPAEPFEDIGNGQYDFGEEFVDRNGVYDPGEEYLDDRNSRYDYGTQVTGAATGLPSPGAGQLATTGSDPAIDPPDLSKMYYNLSRGSMAPSDAVGGWGSDVNVAASSFSNSGKILNQSDPAHIFVRNPTDRQYTRITGKNDYFLEDPTDSTYGRSSQKITVSETGNDAVYYVDGNLYIHNPSTYDFMFRSPGTKITIVAKGNITISDEVRYNGGTSDPQDALSLIAMKDPDVPNSGNIYLGDAQFGTGGDIHAMLYAENNFVDNNLNTSGQSHLTVFGNMTAGNLVAINRSGANRTTLNVTLDERILDRAEVPPDLPVAQSGQRSISFDTTWGVVKRTWYTHSPLK